MLQSALLTFKHSIIIYLVTFHQPSQRQEIFRKILFYLDKYFERFPQFIKEEQLTAIGGQLKITKNKLFGTKSSWRAAVFNCTALSSASPCAKISVQDFSNFQRVHFAFQRRVTNSLKKPTMNTNRPCVHPSTDRHQMHQNLCN